MVEIFSTNIRPIPAPNPVIYKLDEQRYQYVDGADGPHLVDLWATADGLREAARYSPDHENVYHLFTRQNPTLSQPLIFGAENALRASNFNPLRKTVIAVHGWRDSVMGTFSSVVVPAYLEAEDVNMIVVDWSSGAGSINYFAAVANTVTSGQAVARFINWLNSMTSAVASMYHIVGHSLGGHQSGIIGRNVNGDVAYITALDPAFPGWITHGDKFRSTDGVYTEVIHTNVGALGYISTLGDVDFYPNGGVNMPGCDSQSCDHSRCYFYFGESLRSGGFTGQRCSTYVTALTGNCYLWGSLNMGGRHPKTG